MSTPGEPSTTGSSRRNVKWTKEMDIELCQQAILVNPFDRKVTWVAFLDLLRDLPSGFFLWVERPKSVSDHLDTLLRNRAAEVAKEEKSSGRDIIPPNDFQKSVDELLVLKEEVVRAEERLAAQRHGRVAASDRKAKIILNAAMQRGRMQKTLNEDQPGTSTDEPAAEPPTEATEKRKCDTSPPPATPKRKKNDLVEYMRDRDGKDEENRLKETQERRVLAENRLEGEKEERELRRQELEVRKKEAENQSMLFKALFEFMKNK